MPKIHTAPQTQSLFKLEKVRNELSERVELATDQNGQVDLNTVSGPTREILEAIGGGSTFSAADFKTKLESALDTLDRADVDNAPRPQTYFVEL